MIVVYLAPIRRGLHACKYRHIFYIVVRECIHGHSCIGSHVFYIQVYVCLCNVCFIRARVQCSCFMHIQCMNYVCIHEFHQLYSSLRVSPICWIIRLHRKYTSPILLYILSVQTVAKTSIHSSNREPFVLQRVAIEALNKCCFPVPIITFDPPLP